MTYDEWYQQNYADSPVSHADYTFGEEAWKAAQTAASVESMTSEGDGFPCYCKCHVQVTIRQQSCKHCNSYLAYPQGDRGSEGDERCARPFPCRYRNAKQCAHDFALGSECPKVCDCSCHGEFPVPSVPAGDAASRIPSDFITAKGELVDWNSTPEPAPSSGEAATRFEDWFSREDYGDREQLQRAFTAGINYGRTAIVGRLRDRRGQSQSQAQRSMLTADEFADLIERTSIEELMKGGE